MNAVVRKPVDYRELSSTIMQCLAMH
jgi:hypothetical protein